MENWLYDLLILLGFLFTGFVLLRMADDIHAIRKLLEKPEKKKDSGQSEIKMVYPKK